MKKELLILTLFLGVSFKSLAATGRTNDGPLFFLVIVGFLLIILCLLSGLDYLKNNGKTMVNNTVLFFKNFIPTFRNYLNKEKSDFSDLSYS